MCLYLQVRFYEINFIPFCSVYDLVLIYIFILYFLGLEKPIMRPIVICPEIHGESGLAGPTFPNHSLSIISESYHCIIVFKFLFEFSLFIHFIEETSG